MNLVHKLGIALSAGLLCSIPAAVAASPQESAPSLAWENRGQSVPFGGALAIAIEGNIVVATGNVCSDESVFSCDLFVRAHDAKSGRTLWEDRQGPGAFDRSQGVAIDGDRVFASGWYQGPPVNGAGSFDFVVRAYDLKRGTFLWQQRIDRGRVDFGEAVAAKDGRVFAVGRVRGPTGSSDFTTFAFDAKTGTKLWESVIDIRLVDVAFNVVVDGSRVFSTGPIRNHGSVLLVAQDASTGAILWRTEMAGGQMAFTQQGRLIAQGRTLYVAGGIIAANGNEDPMIWTFDAVTGAPGWSRQIDTGGNGEAQSLVVSEDRVIVGSTDGCDATFLACAFSVRALSVRSGDVLWLDRFQPVPGGDGAVFAVVAKSGLVFAGGTVSDGDGLYRWTLRTLDASSGKVVASEFIPSNGDFFNAVIGLAVKGNRLYAAGALGTSPTSDDFTVRGYRLAGNDDD